MALVSSPLPRHGGNRKPFGPTQHIESDAAPDLIPGERTHQIVRAGNGDPVERDDNVTGPQAGALGGGIRFDGADYDRAILGQSGGATARRGPD